MVLREDGSYLFFGTDGGYMVQVGRFGISTSRAFVDWIHAHLPARRKRLSI